MAAARRSCVVLSNGVVGAEKQALALAEAIGLPYTLRRVALPRATRRLPTAAQLAADMLPEWTGLRGERLEAPHPALAISCGRGSVPASVALRADSGGRTLTVHVQRPPCAESHFDLVVAPAHDYIGEVPPPNVLLTAGSLHGVCDAALRAARGEWAPVLMPLPRPRLAVLLGGAVRRRWWQRAQSPELTAARGRELLHSAVAAVAPLGGSVMLATSRRTPPDAVAAAMSELEASCESSGVRGRAWGAEASPNPYTGLLAWADYLVVSADSINMASEACAAGKPTYVFGAEECTRRFGAFHDALRESRRARPWVGALEPPELWEAAGAPSDVERAADRARTLLSEAARAAEPGAK